VIRVFRHKKDFPETPSATVRAGSNGGNFNDYNGFGENDDADRGNNRPSAFGDTVRGNGGERPDPGHWEVEY
jgi:hypothetical protein